MNPTNGAYVAQALTRVQAEVTSLEAELAAAEAALLALATDTEIGSPSTAPALVGDLIAGAARVADLTERVRLAAERATAMEAAQTAYLAAIA